MSAEPLAIGLDVGTGGARAIAVHLDGRLAAASRCELPPSAATIRGNRVEQDPLAWSAAAQAALRDLTAKISPPHIVGVAVDATSGTFLLTDRQHQPLTAGLMYNDLRATEEVDEVAEALRPDLSPYGIEIAASFALPKIVHLARHAAQIFAGARIVHQTDWIVGMLCGRYDVTDVSTALKTGADPGSLRWPAALEKLGIGRDQLPQIVVPGTPIGEVTTDAAERTGIPQGTPVIAGCTDGTAGCLASGARLTGDLNVTLGTTLVFKAVADRPLIDPDGAIYNHRHPAGGYLPGAASSSGGEWIEVFFPGADLQALGAQSARRLPTGHSVYPLVKSGERFPFAKTEAAGFGLDAIADPVDRFAAGMEGLAFLERLSIARIERLGLSVGPKIYATGGGVASETWLRIRAAVNRRVYSVPEQAECAIGAAVLAASPTCGGCAAAISQIVRNRRLVEPDPRLADAYDRVYERFLVCLRERGYL